MTDQGLPEFFEDGEFDELEESLGGVGVLDAEYATLTPMGGNRITLPVSRDDDGNVVPQTIAEACAAAELSVPESTQFFVDGQQVEPTTPIQPGQAITAMGNVKGG